VKKGDGVGKLVFLDRQTLKIAAELDVAPQSASPSYVMLICVWLFTYCNNSYLGSTSVIIIFNRLNYLTVNLVLNFTSFKYFIS